MAGKTAELFRNRIIGYGTKPADQFQANALNYRKHPQRQRDAVQASLRELGWIGVVVENQRTGNLVDGHERVWQALQHNEDVPYIEVDLSEEEERLALAVFDPITNMAETDAAILDDLLREVNTGEAALQALLAEMAEGAGLYAPKTEGDTAPQVDRAEELRQKWQTAAGQLWQLGEHRLIVGDCTDAATVARVMGGDSAELVWTDPPYGVAVGDKNKFLNSIAPSNRIEENLENDTLDETALMAMLSAAFDNAIAHCRAGAAWYVAAPPGPLHVLFGQALKERGVWRQTIQWVKNNATFSAMGVCYHWQAEPIFFGWLPNGAHRWYGGRKQTTVWEIDRPVASPEHPTMKPVELVARAVENSSLSGEVVYEPFSGSGTTIIACENLGRKCRAVEISAAYCAVALQRWADHTQRTPVLLTD